MVVRLQADVEAALKSRNLVALRDALKNWVSFGCVHESVEGHSQSRISRHRHMGIDRWRSITMGACDPGLIAVFNGSNPNLSFEFPIEEAQSLRIWWPEGPHILTPP